MTAIKMKFLMKIEEKDLTKELRYWLDGSDEENDNQRRMKKMIRSEEEEKLKTFFNFWEWKGFYLIVEGKKEWGRQGP
jgi:hypothetical protein